MKYRIFFFCSLLLWKQSLAQTGHEFWFAAPEITEQHADRPINLFVSAFDKAADITITQPANPSFKTVRVSVAANSTKIIDLTSQIELIETKPANTVLNTGLYIQATQEISAYYEVDGSPDGYSINNTDIFVLKGNNALGDTFFIPMQTFWSNYRGTDVDDAWASFDIVATQNNTHVTIIPTSDVVGHAKGESFTVTLNKGQTFSVRASSVLGYLRPTGSQVMADKPIAITYKDDSMIQRGSVGQYGNWDLAGDQLVSIRDIGTEYIAIKASGRFNRDRVFVTATQNNTQLFIDGDTVLLQVGQPFYLFMTTPAVYMQSTAPVYMFHVSAFENELAGALLPPLKCTGAKNITFVRSNEEIFALNILVKSGGERHFRIDEDSTLLPADSFHIVPNTDGRWLYAHVFLDENKIIPQKPYHVKNSTHDFLLSAMNGGTNTGFRYGYFSGFGSVNIGPEKFLCLGDSTVLDAGLGKDAYLWNTSQVTSSITVRDTGRYWVEIKKDVCLFYDTVQVKYSLPITQDIFGKDTSSCIGTPFSIQTKNKFYSYLWQDNSTNATYLATKAGTYWVEVTNEDGCRKSDTLLFSLYPVPNPQIIYNQDLSTFCMDSLVSLTTDGSYASYKWHDGQTQQDISTSHSPDNVYSVTVTSDKGCSAATSFSVDCSPYIFIPNVFTPNGDRVNDYFKIKNVEYGAWRLEIYNRWGNKIFEAEPYLSNWQADGVPDGIYFYVLKSSSNDTSFKGWIQVLR